MKILFFSFLLITVAVQGQDTTRNFELKAGELIWEKTYPTAMTFAQLSKAVIQSGLFDKTDIIDSSISGRTVNTRADYKGAGYRLAFTPTYLISDFIKSFVVVSYGNHVYTVRMKKIVIVTAQDYDSKSNDAIIATLFNEKAGTETTLETYALNKDKSEIRKTFRKDAGKIMNYTFEKTFKFTP